jgi:hypothetical protein
MRGLNGVEDRIRRVLLQNDCAIHVATDLIWAKKWRAAYP